MFTVLNGLYRDMGGELYRAGGFDDRINAFGLAKEKGIFGHGMAATLDEIFQITYTLRGLNVCNPGLAVGLLGFFSMSIGNGDQFHTRSVAGYLESNTAPHKSGADEPDPYWVTFFSSLFQSGIDENHFF